MRGPLQKWKSFGGAGICWGGVHIRATWRCWRLLMVGAFTSHLATTYHHATTLCRWNRDNTWRLNEDGSLLVLTLAPSPIKAFVACCLCGHKFMDRHYSAFRWEASVHTFIGMSVRESIEAMLIRTFVELELIKGSRVQLLNLHVRPLNLRPHLRRLTEYGSEFGFLGEHLHSRKLAFCLFEKDKV